MGIGVVLLFFIATHNNKLPPQLLSSLCYIESSHNPKAVNHDDGTGDSLGICQVKLATARFLGFKGSREDLLNAKTNITYSAKYLKYQLNRYDSNVEKAVAAYNAGTYRKAEDGKPLNNKYVIKVLNRWSYEKSKRKGKI